MAVEPNLEAKEKDYIRYEGDAMSLLHPAHDTRLSVAYTPPPDPEGNVYYTEARFEDVILADIRNRLAKTRAIHILFEQEMHEMAREEDAAELKKLLRESQIARLEKDPKKRTSSTSRSTKRTRKKRGVGCGKKREQNWFQFGSERVYPPSLSGGILSEDDDY